MPARGRRVRCARCSHSWHEPSPEQPPEQSAGSTTLTTSPDSEQEPDSDANLEPKPKHSTLLDLSSDSDLPAYRELKPEVLGKPVTTDDDTAKKSGRALIWAVVAVIVIGGAIGAFAFVKPDEFQRLIGNSKPSKPSVVATPAGWGRVAAPAIQEQIPERLTIEEPVYFEPTSEEITPETSPPEAQPNRVLAPEEPERPASN